MSRLFIYCIVLFYLIFWGMFFMLIGEMVLGPCPTFACRDPMVRLIERFK